MADHAAIAAAVDLDMYFCDPHSPWQRGTKRTSMAYCANILIKAQNYRSLRLTTSITLRLNNRPQETLGWKTPAEALDELLQPVQTTRCCIHGLKPPTIYPQQSSIRPNMLCDSAI